MMAKGLGSGLGALLGSEAMRDTQSTATLPISRIEPRTDQPRSIFDGEKMQELVSSIREHGLIQPITVRPLADGYYQIIAGERRWRAAREAGLFEVPVCVIDAGEQETAEIALIENLQREDLTAMEEARAYDQLMKQFRLTQEQVAERVGKSRAAVANTVRLLKLAPEAQELVESGKLSQSCARTLLELEDKTQQAEIAKKAAAADLSVKEVEALVKRASVKKPPARRRDPRLGADGIDYMAEVERDLANVLGTKVRVSAGAKRGKIEIEYYDAQDFERLYRALKSVKGEGR